MKEVIDRRFAELLEEGKTLNLRIHDYWIQDKVVDFLKWISSAVNLVNMIDQSNGIFISECKKVQQDATIGHSGIPSYLFHAIYAVLKGAHDEWQRGLLRKIEYIIVAETFDDFLDHAEYYHKGNKKIESSILASAVLEDTIKKIARKNGIDSKGKSLESLIDELTKAEVLTPVKAKRIKSYSAVRNHALHAEWDNIDIQDVGILISGVRVLIENYL